MTLHKKYIFSLIRPSANAAKMEEFVRNLLHISDLRVLTKKMVRKKYKEHLGIKDLDKDIRDQLKQVLDNYLEELATSQDEVSSLLDSTDKDSKSEEGNKENTSIKDLNGEKYGASKSVTYTAQFSTNIAIKTEPSDSSTIMSPPKKRVPRTVNKNVPNIKFEDVMAAVQDSDAASGLDDPSDASSDFDMVQKVSKKSNASESESAYEAESETDLDKTLTSKSKYFTPKRSHFEFNSDSLNDSLGEITPVKRGIISDNELEDSPSLAKKPSKRRSIIPESGSESDSDALMIDLPSITSKNKNDANESAPIAKGTTDFLDDVPLNDSDIFSVSDSEPLSKRLKIDDPNANSKGNQSKTAKGAKGGKTKAKSPAKKLLLKFKRVHNNSSDDNYNYEISESNDEERTKNKKVTEHTVPTDDSDVLLVSHDTIVNNLLSQTESESNVSGPVHRPRKTIKTPAFVVDSDTESFNESSPATVNRKVKTKKVGNKKVWYGWDPYIDSSSDFDSNKELHPIEVKRKF